MTRRQLVDGLKKFGVTDAEAASRVIAGESDFDSHIPPKTSPTERAVTPGAMPMRVPFTSRVRQDFAQAVKRASLERQLAGQTPFEIQEIVEAALEPWLRDNGYL